MPNNPPAPQKCRNCGHVNAAIVCTLCKLPMPGHEHFGDRLVGLTACVAGLAMVALTMTGGT